MNCPYPIYIKKHALWVPCGKCGACAKRSISDWTIRCKWELKFSQAAYFLTLTYEKNPGTLIKKDLQDFFKRCRKGGLKISYFALGDYGDTFGRPHYHVLLFVKRFVRGTNDISNEWLARKWQAGDDLGRDRGFVSISRVTMGRISYTVRYGYLARLDWNKDDKRQRPFFLVSKRPALGSSYVSHRGMWHIRNRYWYVIDKGYKKPLPRYYKGKVFAKHGHLQKMHQDRIIVLRQEHMDRCILELSKSTTKPYEKYVENEMRAADGYLESMRRQKHLKNKLLNPNFK